MIENNSENMWNNTLFYNSNWAKSYDDIIKNNWNNSEITEISEIICLLFELFQLCPNYFYSGVVPAGRIMQGRK